MRMYGRRAVRRLTPPPTPSRKGRGLSEGAAAVWLTASLHLARALARRVGRPAGRFRGIEHALHVLRLALAPLHWMV